MDIVPSRSAPRRGWLARRVFAVAAIVGLFGALATIAPAASQAATSLPCDIYANAGTPCVAAHSSTRALFGTYNGPLYQVQRASDNTLADIGLLAAGGYANAAVQDSFCGNTTCTVTKIYDQTTRHNDLTIEAAGDAGPANRGVPAGALPVIAGGHAVYGLSFSGQMGYRNNAATGTAENGAAEGAYMVTSGTHVNGACCFDYGNTERVNKDTGNGHMDAINFGTEPWFAQNGPGPWVQADLENGLFSSGAGYSTNRSYTGDASPFVTALLKNNGQTRFALKDGNAQTGPLTTIYNGALPTATGYSPMHQEGGIVLGTGGDNSNGSIGSFFEGVMTSGYPTDAADNAVQSNVVAVGYGASTGVSGSLANNSEMSLRATTPGFTDNYVRHLADVAVISPITSTSSALDKSDSTWIVRPGLASGSCISLESRYFPGDFLRHYNFAVQRQPMDGSIVFRADATFCPVAGQNGQGTSFQSYNYPGKFLRHYNGKIYIASNGGANPWDTATQWANDVSFIVSTPWAP
ncbi:alpha-L-arabinofuranosidase B [Subtercola frigoramans]